MCLPALGGTSFAVEIVMDSIIYIVGLVVIVMVVAGYFGLA